MFYKFPVSDTCASLNSNSLDEEPERSFFHITVHWNIQRIMLDYQLSPLVFPSVYNWRNIVSTFKGKAEVFDILFGTNAKSSCRFFFHVFFLSRMKCLKLNSKWIWDSSKVWYQNNFLLWLYQISYGCDIFP